MGCKYFISILNHSSEAGQFDDENINKIKQFASKLIVQMINIQSIGILRYNPKILTGEITKQIKAYIQQNIFSDNSKLRNECCNAYSLLFANLANNWTNGIVDIVNSLENIDLLPNGFISILLIMKGIINQINFGNELYQEFRFQFDQTFSFSMNILSKDPTEEKYNTELRISACNYIDDFIKNSPLEFDQCKKDIPIIDLINNLSNSFKIFDKEMYLNLYKLLTTITQKLYLQSQEFFEKILELNESGIDLCVNYPECAMISIDFWKGLISFERSKIKQSKIDRSIKILSPLLTKIASSRIIPKLLNVLENIDENDTAVEDVETKPEPSMYAITSILEFHKILPDETFQFVSEKFKEVIDKKDNWINMHTIMLLIYSISNEPINDISFRFIKNNFNLMIEAASQNQVPRLKETALFVIVLSIQNYPQIFSKNGDYMINELLDLITPVLNIDESEKNNISRNNKMILDRCLTVIYNLSSLWKLYPFELYPKNNFDHLYKIVDTIFNLGISNNDQQLIVNSCEALNGLIFNSSLDILDKIVDIYKKSLEMIEQIKSYNYSQETCFYVQAGLCSIISTSLLKFQKQIYKSEHIIKEFSLKNYSILCDLLSENDNNRIWEEGILAFSSLINAVSKTNVKDELFTEDTIEKLISEFINKGLESKCDSVISATCFLIGNLFYFLRSKIPNLDQFWPDIYEKLSSLIVDNKSIKEYSPYVFKVIADIFNSINELDTNKPDLEVKLKELLISNYDMVNKLDLTIKKNIDFANTFYTYLCDVFGSYAKVYYDNNDLSYEREQLYLLDKLAFYIWKLQPEINEQLILSFMRTARKFGEKCSRRNYPILNRHGVHRILKFGYENIEDMNTKRIIKETVDFLKSR